MEVFTIQKYPCVNGTCIVQGSTGYFTFCSLSYKVEIGRLLNPQGKVPVKIINP